MKLGFPVIDIHTHLRNNIPLHTKIAKESGIDIVVYMANCFPPLDNLRKIKESLKEKRYCKAIPVSAITKNLEGKELVDVDKIKPYVAGFSDDGKYLKDLGLLKEILMRKVLVLVHCFPSYEIGVKNPNLETEFVGRYLNFLDKNKKNIKGWLHIQHVSKKESVKLIKEAKKKGIDLSCETCPHYFTYSREDLDVKVNPPLGTNEDIIVIREGLADGTIDAIASDYAPLPRKTGIAGFRSFLPLSYGLALEGILTKAQLKEKLFLNPIKIIQKGGYKLKI
jgi:dihydroorotase